MKYLFVGDIHNHTYMFDDVKKLDDKYKFDKIIFMGDYVDDWNTSNKESIATLNRVLDLKKSDKRVTLLLGNHELSYLGYPCGGHDYNDDIILETMLKTNIDEFNLTYRVPCGEEEYICSHAGITPNYIEFIEQETGITGSDEDVLSELEKNKLQSLVLLTICSGIRGGRSDCSSFLWCDKNEHRYFNYLNGFYIGNQIVGHTPVERVEHIDTMYYTDTHSTYKDGSDYGDKSYLTWLDTEFKIIGKDEI